MSCSSLSEQFDVHVMMYATTPSVHTSINEYFFSCGGDDAGDIVRVSGGYIEYCGTN